MFPGFTLRQATAEERLAGPGMTRPAAEAVLAWAQKPPAK